MSNQDELKTDFDVCISEASSRHVVEFRRTNQSYKNFLAEVRRILDDYHISKESKEYIQKAVDAQREIENDYMYTRGIRDGITMILFLDEEHTEIHIQGISL